MLNDGPLFDEQGREYFPNDALGALRGPVLDLLKESEPCIGVLPSTKRMVLQTRGILEQLKEQKPELEIHEASTKEHFLAQGYTLVG